MPRLHAPSLQRPRFGLLLLNTRSLAVATLDLVPRLDARPHLLGPEPHRASPVVHQLVTRHGRSVDVAHIERPASKNCPAPGRKGLFVRLDHPNLRLHENRRSTGRRLGDRLEREADLDRSDDRLLLLLWALAATVHAVRKISRMTTARSGVRDCRARKLAARGECKVIAMAACRPAVGIFLRVPLWFSECSVPG
jgi:hypothetical protein